MTILNMIPEKIQSLFHTAFLAPTSFNLQHWQFILIMNEENKSIISKMANNWHDESSPEYLIVLCGDINIWKNADQYARHLNNEQRTMVNEKSAMVYSKYPQNQRDEVFRTCGFAMTNIIWKADQIGLGADLLYGIDENFLSSILNFKSNNIFTAIVALDKGITPISWDCDGDINKILINS